MDIMSHVLAIMAWIDKLNKKIHFVNVMPDSYTTPVSQYMKPRKVHMN